jgi:rifampicin phosphotransferase
MSQRIVTFDSTLADLATVGGKGANLAELTRSGFAVPPGFIVTTDAYNEFVEANSLGPELHRLADSVTPHDTASLARVSDEIRALFSRASVPDEVRAAIVKAYAELSAAVMSEVAPTDAALRASALSLEPSVAPPMPVAVRSSATAEDLPELSFAGQQETYLNRIGAEAVCDSVKACWSSLWTARALGYRARNQVAQDDLALAVVVQQMIAAESSGVAFTANPLTGHRREIVIDASLGLGEAVVAGQVEPDHYVVDSEQWRISSIKLGGKAISIVPKAGGGTQVLEQENAGRQALTDEQVLSLARLAQAVADQFGSPQDIEWAWANEQFYLLQARPVTSLYPLPPSSHNEEALHAYLNFNAIQGMMEPVTPLGYGVFQLALCLICRPSDLPRVGGRLFVDITGLARDMRLRKILLAVLAGADPGARQTVMRLISEGRFAPKQPLAQQARGRRSLVGKLKGLRGALRLLYGARYIFGRAVVAMRKPEEARVRAIAAAEAFLDTVKEHARQSNDLSSCLSALEADVKSFPLKLTAQMVPAILPAMLIMGLVNRWLVNWLGLKPGTGLQLMRGLPGNATTEMSLKLWKLAQTIRSDPQALAVFRDTQADALAASYAQRSLPSGIQEQLEEFFDEYGMRGFAEIDIGRPRWREEPAFVLQMLIGYLRLEDLSAAPDAVFERGAAEAARLKEECLARLRGGLYGFVRARKLNKAIRLMRVLGGMRELPRIYFTRIISIYRPLLLDYGEKLVARGELLAAEDIFFVPVEQLRRFADGEALSLKPIVAAERAEYDREQARRQVPRLLLSTGESFYGGLSQEDSTDFVGDAVSPGVVEGRVRVVLDPQGVSLEPGEILVCPSTDPGWTPLFLMAGGLVTEMGGLVTHGSVVAREYGIPAVVGVRRATELLQTGWRVRLDGSAGRVTVLN